MCLKRRVFSLALKILLLSTARNWDVSSFFSLGPQTEKDLSPYDFTLYRSRFSQIESVEECSDLLGLKTSNNSCKHLGAKHEYI